MTILLIDGDTFVYRHAAGAIQHVNWGNGQWVSFASEPAAIQAMEHALDTLVETLNATSMVVALSSPNCFRREGETAFYTQVLTGDTADNYPGCPKVGPVTAKKILEGATTPQDCWERIVKAYGAAGIAGRDQILLQARLARLLRQGEITSDGKPILWTPP